MLATRARAAAAGGVDWAGSSTWWTSGGATGVVLAYEAVNAPSLAASYTDITGSGNDATVGVAPTWATGTGWTFNGTTQYLITPYQPDATRTRTVLIRFANHDATAFVRIFGASKAGAPAGSRIWVAPQWTSTNMNFSHYSDTNALGAAATSGVVGFGGSTAYKNGANVALLAGAINSHTFALFIGCSNDGGSPTAFANVDILAFVVYDNDIGSAAVSAVSTAMAAL